MNPSKSTLILILVLSAISIGNAGSTLYLPSLSHIAADLNTSMPLVGLSLSCYLITFGIAQVFYGSLSDAFGRKKILLIGVGLFIVGTIISAVSTSIEELLLGRLLEGAGIGAGNAIGFAIFRDSFEGPQLSRSYSYSSIFVGLVPITAPLIGTFLTDHISWRACFILLLVTSIIVFIFIILKLEETNKHKNIEACKPKNILSVFCKLFKSSIYINFALITSIGFSCQMVINMLLPTLVMQNLNEPSWKYALVTVLTGCAYFSGAYLSALLAGKIKKSQIVLAGMAIKLIAIIGGIAIGWFDMNIYTVVVPLFFVLFGLGMIVPTSLGGAMTPFPEIAGSESALLGAFMYTFSSIFSAIGAHLPIGTQIPVLLLLLAMGLTSLIYATKIFKLE